MPARQGFQTSNPYNDAVLFDSSKTTDYFIRKEAAKKAKEEALDKAFNDALTNINDKGVRTVDTPYIIEQKNKLIENFVNNKKAIKDPSIDNGQSYLQFQRELNNLKGDIQKSVNAGAKQLKIIELAKAGKTPFNKRTRDAINLFNLPINNGFIDYDPSTAEYEPKPFDALAFSNKLRQGRPFEEERVTIGVDPNNPLADIVEYKTKFNPTTLASMGEVSKAEYQSNDSVTKYIEDLADNLANNPSLLQEYNNEFKQITGRDLNLVPDNNDDLAFIEGIRLARQSGGRKDSVINKSRQIASEEAKQKRLAAYRSALSYDNFVKKEQYKNIDETTFPTIDDIEDLARDPLGTMPRGTDPKFIGLQRILGDVNTADDSPSQRTRIYPLAVIGTDRARGIKGFNTLNQTSTNLLRKAYIESGGSEDDFNAALQNATDVIGTNSKGQKVITKKGDLGALAIVYNKINQSKGSPERFSVEDAREAMPLIVQQEDISPSGSTVQLNITKVGSPRLNNLYNKKKNAFLQKKKAVAENQYEESGGGVKTTTVPQSSTQSSGTKKQLKTKSGITFTVE